MAGRQWTWEETLKSITAGRNRINKSILMYLFYPFITRLKMHVLIVQWLACYPLQKNIWALYSSCLVVVSHDCFSVLLSNSVCLEHNSVKCLMAECSILQAGYYYISSMQPSTQIVVKKKNSIKLFQHFDCHIFLYLALQKRILHVTYHLFRVNPNWNHHLVCMSKTAS